MGNGRPSRRRQPMKKAAATPTPVTPNRQFGVEVQPGGEGEGAGVVHFVLYAGNVSVACVWAKEDARYVAQLIVKACDGVVDSVEVVRETGLIIPARGLEL